MEKILKCIYNYITNKTFIDWVVYAVITFLITGLLKNLKKIQNKKFISPEEIGPLERLKVLFSKDKEQEEQTLFNLLYILTSTFNFLKEINAPSSPISPITDLSFEKSELELFGKLGVLEEVNELININSQRLSFYAKLEETDFTNTLFVNLKKVKSIILPYDKEREITKEIKKNITDRQIIEISNILPHLLNYIQASSLEINSKLYNELQKGNINILLDRKYKDNILHKKENNNIINKKNSYKKLTLLETGRLIFKIYLIIYGETRIENLLSKHGLVYFTVFFKILGSYLKIDNYVGLTFCPQTIFELYDKIIKEIEIGIKTAKK